MPAAAKLGRFASWRTVPAAKSQWTVYTERDLRNHTVIAFRHIEKYFSLKGDNPPSFTLNCETTGKCATDDYRFLITKKRKKKKKKEYTKQNNE